MKVICSTANKFTDCGCEKCPHGKPHEPIDSSFMYENGKKIPSGKCTSGGRCYIGSNMEWDCQCNPVKKGKMKKAKKAFTLVEIMIVVMVISILAAIAIPSFMESKKRAEKKKEEERQIAQLRQERQDRVKSDYIVLEKGASNVELIEALAEKYTIKKADSIEDSFTVVRILDFDGVQFYEARPKSKFSGFNPFRFCISTNKNVVSFPTP